MASQKKTPVYEDERNQSGTLGKVIGALVSIAAAVLMVYLLIAKPLEGTPMASLANIIRGLGGAIAIVVPLIMVWIGVMFIMSACKKKVRVVNIITNAILFLCLFAAVQLFVTKDIFAILEVDDYPNYIAHSYRLGKGGGFLGALLAFPLCMIGVGGGIIVLILIALVCLAINGRLKQLIIFIRSHRKERPENEHTFEETPVQRPVPQRRPPQQPVRRPAPQRAPKADPYDYMFIPTPEETPEPPKKRAPAAAAPKKKGIYREVIDQDTVPEVDPLDKHPGVEIPRSLRDIRSDLGEAEKPRERKKSTFPRDIPDIFEVAQDEEPFEPIVDIPDAEEVEEETIEMPEPMPLRRKPAKKTVVEGVRPLGVEGKKATQHEDIDADDDDDAPFDIPHDVSPAPKFSRKAEKQAEPEEEEYFYPPIDLLAAGEQLKATRKSSDDDREKADKLIETLHSFGIETRLIGVAHGPVVTRFELQPAPGVKVSRITALADDIALSLAALSVRIEAPIPGKAAVGVEIPNDKVEMVRLRDVLECPDAKRHASRIAVGLGKDNSGRYIVADIAKMPHVLIAGQTGSGKSVCINSIISSILFRATPDEVRMILIDPKVVELSIYNDIPHLIAPVVTDPKKAASALDWAVAEMTMRYKRFAERGVRDIKGYNKALEPGEKQMPQIVIVIDELADLMMVAPGEVESSICRLAQLARACGMHLVIATQRPSVNVITGVIKANIPTRIAFSVASQVDSRTMIDHGGAEKLLGNGDMLFVPPGISKPMRVQGAWVSDEEVHAIVSYIKERSDTTYDEDVVEKIENSIRSDAEKEEIAEEYDSRLEEAVEIVVEAGQASVSMLQRRMRVGYARAGRLIDEMERRGIVSEADGAKPRNVLVTREQFRMMFDEEE